MADMKIGPMFGFKVAAAALLIMALLAASAGLISGAGMWSLVPALMILTIWDVVSVARRILVRNHPGD